MTQAWRVLAAGALLALAGCTQSQLMYRWGNYESVVYDTYFSPGEADPGTQIAKLTENVERTLAEGKLVPPGVHAHLGYLHYSQGRVDVAREEFLIEKELFPESTAFIDGVLRRMDAQ